MGRPGLGPRQGEVATLFAGLLKDKPPAHQIAKHKTSDAEPSHGLQYGEKDQRTEDAIDGLGQAEGIIQDQRCRKKPSLTA
jgi:hypothetical protein